MPSRRLKSAIHWVNKGTEILRVITENRDLDVAAHRVAQHIGQVQSTLLRMSGSFQRALNKIERQRVHLGASGLSTSDVVGWLRELPPVALSQLAEGVVSCVPDSRLVLGDIALDIAEFELIDRERPERVNVPLPPAEDAPTAEDILDDAEDLTLLADWLDQLRVAPDNLPLEQAVPALCRFFTCERRGSCAEATRLTYAAYPIALASRREPWRHSSAPKGASKLGASSRTARCSIE